MDEKLSANEIVKALICCCDDSDGVAKCAICPFNIDDYQDFCVDELLEQALSLINRQKAENEKMQETVRYLLEGAKLALAKAKAEAIKEFAERLRAESGTSVAVHNGLEIYSTKAYTISAVKLDNLVKEMVGDSDA